MATTTARRELTSAGEKLFGTLGFIERYGHSFSYSELMDVAKMAKPILDQLIEELPEDQIPAIGLTAQDELNKLFLPNGHYYTDGLIVVVLLVVRSGIRQLLDADPDLTPIQALTRKISHLEALGGHASYSQLTAAAESAEPLLEGIIASTSNLELKEQAQIARDSLSTSLDSGDGELLISGLRLARRALLRSLY